MSVPYTHVLLVPWRCVKSEFPEYDRTLLSSEKWGSSELLRSEQWSFLIEVSGQRIGPFLSYVNCVWGYGLSFGFSNSKNGTDLLSRNVDQKLLLLDA